MQVEGEIKMPLAEAQCSQRKTEKAREAEKK
jgi:hypothetical protein